ncbi:exodeoxyribonuclease VII large subunit, partial [Salmonella enterica subsp. enterica serovar Heidelberg str. SARA36]
SGSGQPVSHAGARYTVSTTTDGKVLKKIKQVKAGDIMTTRLEDGWLESEVKSVTPGT